MSITDITYEQVCRVELVNNNWFRDFDRGVYHYVTSAYAREPELIAKSLARLPEADLRIIHAMLGKSLSEIEVPA